MDLLARIDTIMDAPASRYMEDMWPLNVLEVFDIAKGGGYFFIEDEPMDNVESMRVFLQSIPDENIVLDDGTQVILQHEDYDFHVQVDSGGGGDFHLHVFDLTQLPKV